MQSVILFDDYKLFEDGTCFSLKSHRWLKPDKNNKGYERLRLYSDGKLQRVFTHIKVVEYFGDCKGNHIPKNNGTLVELGLSIDHLDMNKHNNSRDNLELVTHSENLKRMWQNKHAQLADELPF